MQKSPLYSSITLLSAALLMFMTSCSRNNGIDNSQIVETPYSLYFSDSAGALFYTNDGHKIVKVFSPDGQPSKALVTSGEYILWCKNNIMFSVNDGKNFDHSFDFLRSYKGFTLGGVPIDLNQSQIVNCKGSPDIIYAVSSSPHNVPAEANYLGLAFNNNHGYPKNWSPKNDYDTLGVGAMPVKMISLTQGVDGKLYGLALNQQIGDTTSLRNFVLNNPNDLYDRFSEVTGSKLGNPADTSGNELPPNGTNPLPGHFSLGHFNNRLIAIDATGINGAWYCDDGGRNWNQYTGIPANTPLLCQGSPFEEVAFIGTYGQGLYMLNTATNVWERNNSGLASNLIVRSIAWKENIYKNNTKQKYVYLATNKGIYQSLDGGLHWVLTIQGNYTALY